jgi:hypothetical protein
MKAQFHVNGETYKPTSTAGVKDAYTPYCNLSCDRMIHLFVFCESLTGKACDVSYSSTSLV